MNVMEIVFAATLYLVIAFAFLSTVFDAYDPFEAWPGEAASVARVAVSLLWPLVFALAAVAVALRCSVVLVRGVRQMIGMVRRRPGIPRAEARSRRIR